MREREQLAVELFTVLSAETGFSAPLFVADECPVLDFWYGTEDEIRELCRRHYGGVLTDDDLHMPLWQLLDRLDAERRRRLYERYQDLGG